ncbi:MAG: hypothetical protein ACOCSJ_03940 [Candidatus Natronoplasma sp.]
MGIDSKKRIPVSDLDEILRVVKEKKGDVEVDRDHNSIVMKKGSKTFKVNKNGVVKGSMPLHSFNTQRAESLEIGRDEIEVHYENGDYVFKI